jgi:hypothetical protein
MRCNKGTLQREWAEKYGPVVRAVGPLGVERMMFLSPSALQRVLVTEWMNYPRVNDFSRTCNTVRSQPLLSIARLPAQYSGDICRLWFINCNRKRT